MEDLIEIGWTGRPHGLNGEIKLRVEAFYEEDLANAPAVFIGAPPVPFFTEHVRGGGAVIAKFEGFDSREAIGVISNRPLFLPREQVREKPPVERTPYDHLVGFDVVASGYPRLGPIEEIFDLPSHYLAGLTYQTRPVLIPLHEQLILNVRADDRVVEMDLPLGLLDLEEE